MPVNDTHDAATDAVARKLRGLRAQPPRDEFAAVMLRVHPPRRRGFFWLWLGAGLLLAGGVGATVYSFGGSGLEPDKGANAVASLAAPEQPAYSIDLSEVLSRAASEQSAPETAAESAAAPPRRRALETSEWSNAAQSPTVSAATLSALHVDRDVARGQVSPSTDDGVVPELTPAARTSAAGIAPEEFDLVAGTPGAVAERRSVSLASLGQRDLTFPWEKTGGLTCPSLSRGVGSELRVQAYAGLRHDRRTSAVVKDGNGAYLDLRDSLETFSLGLGLGLRAELGKPTGFFGGIGLDYNYYGSEVTFYGPTTIKTNTTDVVLNGVIIGVDTITTISREVDNARNKHHSFTFTGSVGYRYAMPRVAYYGAIDAGFEVVTYAVGANYGVDRSSYIYGTDRSDWVARTPGLSLGARVGADVELMRGIGGEPSPLGLLMEASVRRTGSFSGDADPLDYRLLRVGASVGLRYTF